MEMECLKKKKKLCDISAIKETNPSLLSLGNIYANGAFAKQLRRFKNLFSFTVLLGSFENVRRFGPEDRLDFTGRLHIFLSNKVQ